MRFVSLILFALAGCATVPPPAPNYVCVPATTSTGTAVIYCQPHQEGK